MALPIFWSGIMIRTVNPSDQALWCAACRVQYEVGTVDPRRTYRCARCRAALVDPTGSTGDTWLYAARPSTSTAPTLDDARTTWTDADTTTDHEAPIRRFSHYEIQDELGRGGMGVVYRAWDLDAQRTVALKVLIGGRFADRTAIERFLREADAASRLDHPGLVRVLDHGEWEGQPWYAMEVVDGPSLKDVLDDIGRPPVEEVVRIGAALARALAHAHARGVSHRDVKPENVLLRVTGEPVLTDFGLVMEQDHARLTRTGQVMGTPAYLAPELARGEKEPDWNLVDIYALGTLMYELATGKPAYEGDAGMQVLMDVLEGPPPAPRSIEASVPRDLDTVIQRAMARFPEERFPSAVALAEDLVRLQTGDRIHARPLSASYRTRLWLEQNGRMASVAGMTLALCLGLAAIGVGARARLAEAERVQAWKDASARLVALQPELERMEARGEQEQVELALEAFVENERLAGSPATSEALRVHARRLRNRGDAEGELLALGQAWSRAPTPESSAAALDSLLEAMTARWWYDRVETLARGLSGPGLDARRALAATARRDLEAARVAWKGLPDGVPEVAPIVETVLQGQATGHRARYVHRIDDERLLLVSRDGLVVVEAAPGLPRLGTWELGRPVADAWPVGEDRLLTWGGGTATLWVRGQDDWNAALEWEESRILDAQPAPGMPDTVLVAVGPYARQLLRLDRGAAGWSRRSAHPGTDLTTSDVVALASADLPDTPGRDLLVAVGPWNAFDVRWLTVDERGELTLRARRKLGYVSDLAPIAWGGRTLIAAAKADSYPSRRTFPLDKPFGEPAGLYLLQPDDALATADQRRLPTPVGEPSPRTDRLLTGDIDGDGAEDIAVGARTMDDLPWLLLYRQGGDGLPHQARMRGLSLLEGTDLDGDGDLELIVGLHQSENEPERELWVLGAGVDQVPAIPVVDRPSTPPPGEMGPELARAWSRADRLAAVGASSTAAALYEDMAADAPTTELADASLLRAATLWASEDRMDRSEAAARAVRGSAARAQALDLRARALIRSYRFDEAHALDEQLAAIPNLDVVLSTAVAERAPLYAMLQASNRTWLEFDRPLDAGWRMHRPLAVLRDPRAGALVVDTVVGAGVLAELPLERTGGVLELLVEGEVERVEWAAGLAIQLEPDPDEHALGVRVAGWGGGALLETQLGCVLPGDGLIGPRIPAEPADPKPFRARVQIAPALREISCLVEDGRGRRIAEARQPLRSELPEAGWRLVIRSAGESSVATPMHARMRIDRIALGGVGIPDTSRGAGAPYAEGDLDRALAELAPGPSVLRAAVLAELGQRDAAREALPDLDGSDPDWMLLLRSRPELAQDLAPAVGERWYPMFHAAWNVAAVSHPHDPGIHERLIDDLDGIEQWTPADPDERAIRTELLAARGRALWAGGQGPAARRDLEAAVADAARVIAQGQTSTDGARIQSGRLVWMEGHATLAAIAIAGGDDATARAHAEQALVHAPFRELAVDRLLMDAKIAEHRTDPAWSSVFDGPAP